MKLIPIAVVAVFLSVLPFLISGYHQGLATYVAIYFIAILGLNILTGYTGQISIGHGAFMAIGGYTTTLLSADRHWSLLATLPASLAIAFLCGLVVGIPALRLSGVYLALATFALAVSVPQFPLKFSKFLGGSNGIHTANTESHLWLYIVGWSCAAIAFASAWLLLRGRIGRAFRAVRDSELAAASSGVSLPIYKTRGSRVRRPPARRRTRCPGDRLRPRPGRRLRPDRRPGHAFASERLRRLPPAL